ncbi:MAG: methylated-DNA--[protein]-cysteine S-methyltransferase [Ktedonobacterales bacterium]
MHAPAGTKGPPNHTTQLLATGIVTTWIGATHITASPHGIREVSLPSWTPTTASLDLGAPEIVVEQSDGGSAERHLRQGMRELAEYVAGERQVFTVALDLSGPEFFRRVWDEVARVAYGETRSYAEIARAVVAPTATRAVGAANGANPVAPFVPCHRIVGSDGRLTGYGPGLPLKQRLLVMEGALPASPDDYDAWIARIHAHAPNRPIYLGIRRTSIYCLPACPRISRQRLLPNRIFHSPAEAAHAGFRPCAVCKPATA